VTGQEVILDLLRYIGVTGFTAVDNDQRLNRPGLDNDDIRRALAALNSALQTIQKYGPQSLKDDERAAFFNNPTSVQIVALVTNGQSATLSAPPPAWMVGCSILVPGDSDMNRIAKSRRNRHRQTWSASRNFITSSAGGMATYF
jgi:hypothetical protein